MISDLQQKAIGMIAKMSDEQASFIIRIFENGSDCVQAFLDSGITSDLREANRFLDEWEAQHE